MAIQTLELTDFTAFKKATLSLSPGINVFIGENATGKTHAMKALYVLARAALHDESTFPEKLARTFRPDDLALGRLGHRRPGQRTAGLAITDGAGASIDASIATRSSKCSVTSEGTWKGPSKAVFVPSREGLASFEGFIAAYLNRELAFDETYYDLAVALSTTALRGALPKALQQIGADLEATLGGKVVIKGARFYVQGEGGSMLEAPLLSEGMRKLATVLRLLQNGELREAGLLCWDEPEANLNPKLTVVVADALARLARNKVQVVLATHDYLLTETLALRAREDKKLPVRFFSFVRNGAAVEVSVDDDLYGLKSNPIREAFLAHYDRARAAA
jgi:energy-coupling factor transporter ATP-binding protein EcfA2